jgi:hypothetical protein
MVDEPRMVDLLPFDISIAVDLVAFSQGPDYSSESRHFLRINRDHGVSLGRYSSAFGLSSVSVDQHPGLSLPVPSHESRRLLAEFDIAVNIQSRLSIAVARALRAARNVLSGEHNDDDLVIYDPRSGTLTARPDAVAELFNLRQSSQFDDLQFFFEIGDVSLNSPINITGRFRAFASVTVMGLRIIGVDVGITEAPVEITQAQAILTGDFVKNTVTFLGSTGVVATLYVHHSQERQRKVDQIFTDLTTEDHSKDNIFALQKSLKELGFYKGELDKVPGDETNAAARSFARSVRLPDNIISYKDRIFCRILAEKTVDSTWNRWQLLD